MPESPKKFFAVCVDEFITKTLAERMGHELFDPTAAGDPAYWRRIAGAARLRRLASDDRALSIWRAFHGDKAACEDFLFCVTRALLEFAAVEEQRQAYNEALSELRELEGALQTVDRYCAVQRALEALPGPQDSKGAVLRLPEGLERKIEGLRVFAREKAAWERRGLGPLLPISRKARTDFLVHVHFARLLVRRMLERFQRQHFQIVADTINVLFDQSKEATANSVRNAWRRRDLGKRRRYAYADIMLWCHAQRHLAQHHPSAHAARGSAAVDSTSLKARE